MTEAARQPVHVFEGFRLDAQRRVLHGTDGQPIALTPRLFDTLLYFVERAGQLLTKEQLLEDLWPNVVVEEHNLNKTVSELRRLLGEKPGEHKFIVTKPGRGYRFVADVVVASEPGADSEFRAADAGTRQRPREARTWVAAAIGAAVIAGFVAVFGFLGTTPDAPLRETAVSLERGGQSRAVWSPDGKAVAFGVREQPGEPYRIVVRDLGSPAGRAITSNLANPPVLVQWTTAGRILFAAGPSLWSVSPVAGTPEVVAGVDLSEVQAIAATRDGMTLALVRRGADGAWGVWTTPLPAIDLKKYEAPELELGPVSGAALAFSPDGRQLLVSWWPVPERIWILPFPRTAAERPRPMPAKLPSPHNGLAWAPDNTHIVATAGEGTSAPQLHLVDTRSGALRSLTNDGRDHAAPAVSPDGNRLVYLNRGVDFDIVTLTLDRAEVRPLIATQSREEQPAWAADVPALVYLTNRNGPYEIWLRASDQPDRPLIMADDFPTKHLLLAPSLSPDGTRVIFQAVDYMGTGNSHLWMRSVAGGALERVTNGGDERAGSWSPDGTWYVYSTVEPDSSLTLKKVRTSGTASPETLLAGVARTAIPPIWSPDGQWILVPDGGVKLISADGATIRELGIEDSPCAFAPAEERIYCLRAPQTDGRRSLAAIDFAGRVVEVVGSVPPDRGPASSTGELAPNLRFTLTPDGSSVTYSAANVSSGLWLMEGLSQVRLP